LWKQVSGGRARGRFGPENGLIESNETIVFRDLRVFLKVQHQQPVDVFMHSLGTSRPPLPCQAATACHFSAQNDRAGAGPDTTAQQKGQGANPGLLNYLAVSRQAASRGRSGSSSSAKAGEPRLHSWRIGQSMTGSTRISPHAPSPNVPLAQPRLDSGT